MEFPNRTSFRVREFPLMPKLMNDEHLFIGGSRDGDIIKFPDSPPAVVVLKKGAVYPQQETYKLHSIRGSETTFSVYAEQSMTDDGVLKRLINNYRKQ